ncbi:MAG: prepilin-type N-terminal cleavage/methylation domain-containing protein [Myxococcales bacterium]|nr:prepilin-type N-terminal cleavage/methylation domain-containing protein [Myxococcales bacterium]
MTAVVFMARRRRRAGFTLVEMVVVVAVVAIMATTAIPQLGTLMDERTLEGAALEVRAMMLYARARSIGGMPHGFQTDVPLQWVAVNDIEAGDVAVNPVDKVSPWKWAFGNAGEKYEDVAIVSSDFDGADGATFDVLGKPSVAGTVVLGLGDLTRTIRLKAMTGEVVLE